MKLIRNILIMICIIGTLAMPAAATSATSTMQWKQVLAWQARFVALHGGILGTCKGCATPRMKSLMRQVYVARFADNPRAIPTILCIVGEESGFNPGAISATDDFGGLQANRAAHEADHPEWFQKGRGFKFLIFDPWLGASEMWAMSSRGTDFSPWTGTYGHGDCH